MSDMTVSFTSRLTLAEVTLRGPADGSADPSGQKLDRPEAEAPLERELAEQPPRLLVQLGRVGPADVLAAWAAAGFLMTPRPRCERPRMAAAKALDGERLHGRVLGARSRGSLPSCEGSATSRARRVEERVPARELDPRPAVRLAGAPLGLVDRLPAGVEDRVGAALREQLLERAAAARRQLAGAGVLEQQARSSPSRPSCSSRSRRSGRA